MQVVDTENIQAWTMVGPRSPVQSALGEVSAGLWKLLKGHFEETQLRARIQRWGWRDGEIHTMQLTISGKKDR